MILGIGDDLIDVRRVERLLMRFGERFTDRVLAQEERLQLKESGRNQTLAARIAKRIAAKEAAAKALGTGFREGIGWRDFEIGRDALGKPTIILHGAAVGYLYRKLRKGDRPSWHLSLSDEYPYAQAFVVLEIMRPPY